MVAGTALPQLLVSGVMPHTHQPLTSPTPCSPCTKKLVLRRGTTHRGPHVRRVSCVSPDQLTQRSYTPRASVSGAPAYTRDCTARIRSGSMSTTAQTGVFTFVGLGSRDAPSLCACAADHRPDSITAMGAALCHKIARQAPPLRLRCTTLQKNC